MNKQLQDFARQSIKMGLAELPEKQVELFKLMYARDSGRRSTEAAKEMAIDKVVDEVPEKNLDWAMQQVQRSIEKHKEKP